jgi:hypothetical protein
MSMRTADSLLETQTSSTLTSPGHTGHTPGCGPHCRGSRGPELCLTWNKLNAQCASPRAGKPRFLLSRRHRQLRFWSPFGATRAMSQPFCPMALAALGDWAVAVPSAPAQRGWASCLCHTASEQCRALCQELGF